jgi:hypothetical protein
MAKVAKVSIIELMDQRFCIAPPYRTTRPGTLIKPTNVAAVNCQDVSPVLSHGADPSKKVSFQKCRDTDYTSRSVVRLVAHLEGKDLLAVTVIP